MTGMDFPSSPMNGTQTADGRYYFDSSVGTAGGWRSTPLPVGGLPAGSIMQWAMPTLPANWLLCDGSAVSRSVYSSLFAVVGTTYGTGDGSTTFNLPDIPNGTTSGIVGQVVGTNAIVLTNTTVADLPGMATTVAMKAGRTYKLTFSSSQMASQQTSSNRLQLIYVLNGTVIERQYFGNAVANNYGNPFTSEVYYTAVADGSVALKIQAFIDVGSGTYSFYADSGTSKNIFTVEDLGEGTASTVRQRHIIKASAGWTAGDSELATRMGVVESRDLSRQTVITRRIISALNSFTSTSYVTFPNSADRTAMTISFTKRRADTKLLVRVNVSGEWSAATPAYAYAGIKVGSTNYDVAQQRYNNSGTRMGFSGENEVAGLSAGVYTIEPIVRVAAGAWNMYTGDDYLFYTVEETY